MIVSEIRQEFEFNALADEWNRLLASSVADTIFLTHEWLRPWWDAYGTRGDLRILLARDACGELRGIAPLRRRKSRRYGRSYEVLSFMGDGSGDSDYLDFIIRRGDEREVMSAFAGALRRELDNGAVLEANSTPESSPAYSILREIGQSAGSVWVETDVPCSTVALPSTWDEYLKMLASRFRTKVRSVLRAVSAEPDLQFEMCDTPAKLDEYLPVLFDLHTRRWAKVAKPGVFRGADKRRFYGCMSRTMLERGALFFSGLRWRGKLLACQYGFVHNGVYSQLQEGYEPESEHWNAGVALRAWSIQQLLTAGVKEYDFLAGVGRHKSDWGSVVKNSKMAVLARATVAGTAYCRGPKWEIAARQAVKRLMPADWIAARDARQERERVAEWDRHHQPGSEAAAVPEWVRSAASRAYYYSPLFVAAPAIRDRYRLRMSRRPGIERRHTPTLRILYYHRINNENDPFLPSMPIAEFEKHIRIVARHYRVVSLREGMRRLAEGGPAEPVVAITFDDGYADNCTEALPILQRYGAPATIFLTTGSVDSREPMWFEVLAVALKKTDLSHIDVELDVPRRFLLRTQAERLAANGTIFAHLRMLSDSDRCAQLAEILRRLSAESAPELRGRMLTWDQVRHMRSFGIDFGGHTVTHPFVSRLTPEQALWEIAECKHRIEQETQADTVHFAYPNGRESDFQAWNKEIVAAAGYKAAVSTLWGVNHPGIDRMELRRGQPWEDGLPLFAAKLDWYQFTDN
jgi:peptidoglycan/xylan/chitin deacetylase (PgdA/CDA1 family)/CelD/BcsL family acetyltransferase involved in cellulose biosynthesis